MDAYAVVETGGKQYLVKANDTFNVERLEAEVGAKIELGTVLAISNGKTLKIGLPVLESMACGTPAIAFDRGSMPELIENGKNGFLVNTVDEAIETVARIKEIDRAFCRRHVERHFTVDRMIDQYIQAYEMILQDRPL